MYAAERMDELANDEELTSPRVRNLAHHSPQEGIGACEAPRGTLFHHYQTNDRGIMERMNLLVATQNTRHFVEMLYKMYFFYLLQESLSYCQFVPYIKLPFIPHYFLVSIHKNKKGEAIK